MKNTKFYSYDLELKSLSNEGEFSGYGACFNSKDCQNDIIMRGAFAKTLDRWRSKDQLPHLIWQHKLDEPIGNFTEMAEDKNGLYVEGRLLIDADPVAKRAHAHLKNGSVRGMSIGYRPIVEEYDSRLRANLLKELDLIEVSLVTRPANESAQVQVVKDAFTNPRNMERYLRDVGFSIRQAKRLMAEGFKGVSRDDETEEQLKTLIQTLRNI